MSNLDEMNLDDFDVFGEEFLDLLLSEDEWNVAPETNGSDEQSSQQSSQQSPLLPSAGGYVWHCELINLDENEI